ncbi:MAG TPA: hypothetical protein VKA26_12505 [Ignavibacteriaceae bacterium]|nr:hypothetical protein [Ignavibacteriaceae bacterium]
MKNKIKTKPFLITALTAVFVVCSFGFYSSRTDNFLSNGLSISSHKNVKGKKYSFSTKENGKKIYWKVIMRDGEIEKVYRDGDKLSEDEIDKYRDMIINRIEELEEDLASLDNDFDFDFDFPKNFSFHFDSDEFNEQMEELKEKLINMKSVHINVDFDKESFRESMKEMKRSLEKLKDEDFFDDEAFQKSMEKLNDEISKNKMNFNFDFDFSDLAKSLDKVKFNLKDIKVDMSKLREKMKILKHFLKDMKSELIKDGYLDEDDDDFDLEFSSDKLEVNGKRLPDNLLEKYKDMYEDYFGKELDGNFNISR